MKKYLFLSLFSFLLVFSGALPAAGATVTAPPDVNFTVSPQDIDSSSGTLNWTISTGTYKITVKSTSGSWPSGFSLDVTSKETTVTLSSDGDLGDLLTSLNSGGSDTLNFSASQVDWTQSPETVDITLTYRMVST